MYRFKKATVLVPSLVVLHTKLVINTSSFPATNSEDVHSTHKSVDN